MPSMLTKGAKGSRRQGWGQCPPEAFLHQGEGESKPPLSLLLSCPQNQVTCHPQGPVRLGKSKGLAWDLLIP